MRKRKKVICLLLLLLLVGCGRVEPEPAALPSASALWPASGEATATASISSRQALTERLPSTAPTATQTAPDREGLSASEAATLESLEKVDEYPLYTMHYYGDYAARRLGQAQRKTGPIWGCSLFAALGNSAEMLYGRNFDWEYSPALFLFTDPPDGYASMSVVDIAYLGFGGSRAGTLLDLPLGERRGLLAAPLFPFDGMNEQGLAIGIAAVPPGEMVPDPSRPTTGSLGVIRQMLDGAADVDEAVAILQSYNVDMAGGPPLHYLLADRSGRSLLVEFYQGKTVLLYGQQPWHLATNFLRAAAGDSPRGECSRYDKIDERLSTAEGWLNRQQALDLLREVSQTGTQWSAVYGLSTGEITLAIGQDYSHAHLFHLGLSGSITRP